MISVLHSFYDGFSVELDKAMESVSKDDIEIPVEETDIICDKCGSRMIVKTGKFGKFAACPNFPTCKNTKPLVSKEVKEKKKETVADFKCEKCGADMVLRSSRFGSFYACSNYPQCKFIKQKNKEIDVPCPKCGGKIVTKYGKRKTVFYSCKNYPQCDFSSWDMPSGERCPDCGEVLFRKKGKNILVCENKSCGYKRESEQIVDKDEN